MQVTLVNDRAIVISHCPSQVSSELNSFKGAVFDKNGKWYIPAMYPFSVRIADFLTRKDILKLYTITEDIQNFVDRSHSIASSILNKDIQGYCPVLKPYEHQLEALSLAMHMPRVGLFLDPGLGKTKVACDLICHLFNQNKKIKVLILALKVNLYTWKKEMDVNSANKVSLFPIKSMPKAKRESCITSEYGTNTGIVMSYDSAKVSIDILKTLKFDLIIADESHSLRTPTSDRTKKILQLVEGPSSPNRRIILSGTPSLGNPLHLWGQLKFLGNFIVPDYWKFRSTYLQLASYNQNIVLGTKNIDKLSTVVAEVSMRKKAIDCLDLPERVIQVIEVPPTDSIKIAYNKIVRYNSISTETHTIPAPENAVTAMTKAAQICSGFAYVSNRDSYICDGCAYLESCVTAGIKPYTSKCLVDKIDPGRDVVKIGDSPVLESAVELTETHLQSESKVILWAKHRETLDSLYTTLSTNHTVFRYDHTTENMHVAEYDFNSFDGPCVIICQIAYGIGVTFKAPVMIYVELSFSLDHWLQSLDRNYGIRAKGFSSLLVQVVVIQNSLASSTIKLLENKIQVSNLLTTKPSCVTCDKAVSCINSKIEPFEDGCIYPSSYKKQTIPIQEI